MVPDALPLEVIHSSASEILKCPNVAVPGLTSERKVLPIWRRKRISHPLSMTAMQQLCDAAGARYVNQIIGIRRPASRKEAVAVRCPRDRQELLPTRVNRDLTPGPVPHRKDSDAPVVCPGCDA